MSAGRIHRARYSRIFVFLLAGSLMFGLLPAKAQTQDEHVFTYGPLHPGWVMEDTSAWEGTYALKFSKPIDHPYIPVDAQIEVIFGGAEITMDQCRVEISKEPQDEALMYEVTGVDWHGPPTVWDQPFNGVPAVMSEADGELIVLHPPAGDGLPAVTESFGTFTAMSICVDSIEGVYLILAGVRPDAVDEADTFMQTFQFGTPGRIMTVTAYDGRDNRHYPLTFEVLLEQQDLPDEDGISPPRKPIANESVFWFVSNGTSVCFKDAYDAWDPVTATWVRREHDMNLTGMSIDLWLTTDANGRAHMRLYYDYGGIRVGGFGSPCSIPIEIELTFRASRGVVPATEEDAQTYIEQKASLTLNYAAFVTSVHAKIPDTTPVIAPPESTKPLPRAQWKNAITLPEQQKIYSRLFVDDVPFAPPIPGTARYVMPLPLGTSHRPGAVLTLDMTYRSRPVPGEEHPYYPDPGTAIAVEVMWIDGSRAFFIAENRENIRSPLVNMIIAPIVADIQNLDPNAASLYFLGSNGLEFVAQVTTIGVATAINPVLGATVAGAWGIYEFYDTPRDLYELGEILSRNGYMVLVQSEIAVTLADDGTQTVYTFEGAPAVYQDGILTQAYAGDAIEISPDWIVGPATQTDPPEAAQEAWTLFSSSGEPGSGTDPTSIEPGIAPTIDDDDTTVVAEPTAVPGSGTTITPDDDGSGLPVLLIVIGLVALGGVILFAILRSRKPPLTPQPAAGLPPGPVMPPAAPPGRQPQPRAPSQATPVAGPVAPPRAAPFTPAQPMARQTAPVATAATCPVCGAAVSVDARFCGTCGASIPVTPQPVPEVSYCTRCGTRASPGALFCMACGSPLASTQDTPGAAPVSR